MDKPLSVLYSSKAAKTAALRKDEYFMSKQMRANLLLVLTALIWGVAFVAQDVAAEAVPPMYFNGLRMSLAALAILPTVWLMDRRAVGNKAYGLAWKQMSKAQKKELLIGGTWCGVLLTLGSTSQQFGLSMGASVLVARAWGSGDQKKVSDASHTAITLGLICGVSMLVLGFLISKPLLRLINT